MSGPSGTGKTTLAARVLDKMPGKLQKVITCTTREKREGETPGVDYHFLSHEEFEEGIKNKEFLEHVSLYGFYYGTRKKDVLDKLSEGQSLLLLIDVQGAEKVKKEMHTKSIFILPPSLEELKRRLLARGSDAKASIEERLSIASKEIDQSKYYDYKIVNANIDDTVDEIVACIQNS